jgi:sec-independent protein translocase protein TatA
VGGGRPMFRSLGPWEIALILVIVLIIFGVGKLPQIGGAIGRSVRNFKKAQAGEDEEEDKPKTQVAKRIEDNSGDKSEGA